MALLKSSLLAFLATFLVLAACGDAEPLRRFYNKMAPPANYTTFYVDSNGYGNYPTIQAAIDHIPSENKNWVRIYVKAGIYREQIHIPFDKPFIYIQGEGKWKTRVVYYGVGPITTCAALISQADNIVIKSMSFTNTYNFPPGTNKNQVTPALAAMISGDKSAFYRVAFLGFQDTLWDVGGRHYFKLCTIQGAVDFIFGDGQSIYERCTISVVAGPLHGLPGFITAQARSNPRDSSGFVFKSCNIVGDGATFLGRPWRNFARVIFYNTSMSNVVVPLGWNAWDRAGHEYELTFAEHDCHGVGANTSGRVNWEYKLSDEMVKKLTDMTYVDDEGWISQQPFSMLD